MILRKFAKLFALYNTSIHYNRTSRDLHRAMILNGLGTLLRAKLGVARLRAAVVGHDRSILSLSEQMGDAGFDIRFFAGHSDDRMHPSDSLETLKPNNFSVALVIEEDSTREQHLVATLNKIGIPVVRLRLLIDAHFQVLNKMSYFSSKPCLNASKQAIIAAAIATTNPEGIIVECGVYMGGTTIYMALLQEALDLKRQIFALDTYEGMPEPVLKDHGGGFVYTSDMFTDNRKEIVAEYYRKSGVDHLITMVPGLCQDTLPAILEKNKAVALTLLDTDQYSGTKGGLDCVGPILNSGELIIIDDTTVDGVDVAIKEAINEQSRLVRRPMITNFDAILSI